MIVELKQLPRFGATSFESIGRDSIEVRSHRFIIGRLWIQAYGAFITSEYRNALSLFDLVPLAWKNSLENFCMTGLPYNGGLTGVTVWHPKAVIRFRSLAYVARGNASKPTITGILSLYLSY